MSLQTLLIEDHGAVRVITLNRPAKRNAINVRMCTELSRAIAAADADDDVRVIVVTGAGKTFTSGADVSLFLGIADDMSDTPADQVVQPIHITRAFHACSKPLIAAINGPTVGMGTTILPHFDLVYASSAATFSTPFVKLGLVVEFGGSFTLPRLIGEQRARELILRGTPIDAATAADWGLVARVFAQDSFMSSVLAVAHEIADNPPSTVRKNKVLLRRGADASSLEQAIAQENEVLSECYGSPENVAAVQRFLKR